MFNFIPDFPITFLKDKHIKYITGSIYLLLSTKNTIAKFEDKRLLFLYCLVQTGKYLQIAEIIKKKFKSQIQAYLLSNFFIEIKLNKSKQMVYFVNSKTYRDIKVKSNFIELQPIYSNLLCSENY
jgi:hypothetical protein